MPATELRTPSVDNTQSARRDEYLFSRSWSSISWGAVIAGSLIGLVIQLWLSMLGVAIGASTVEPLSEADPMKGLGVAGAVWLAVSVIISSWIGGWVAGRFSASIRRAEAAMHGLSAWAVVQTATFLLAGTVFGMTLAGVGRAASVIATGNTGKIISYFAASAASREVDQTADVLQGEDRGRNRPDRRDADAAAKAVARAQWVIAGLMFLGLCAGVAGAATSLPRLPGSLKKRA